MIINNKVITGIGNQISPKINNNPKVNSDSKFGDILKSTIDSKNKVQFSKHAQERLEQRNITLTNEQLDKLNSAVQKAQEKRVNEALVLLDDTAMVVNIKNKMVVTVASTKELKENVFTNIDGAVIA